MATWTPMGNMSLPRTQRYYGDDLVSNYNRSVAYGHEQGKKAEQYRQRAAEEERNRIKAEMAAEALAEALVNEEVRSQHFADAYYDSIPEYMKSYDELLDAAMKNGDLYFTHGDKQYSTKDAAFKRARERNIAAGKNAYDGTYVIGGIKYRPITAEELAAEKAENERLGRLARNDAYASQFGYSNATEMALANQAITDSIVSMRTATPSALSAGVIAPPREVSLIDLQQQIYNPNQWYKQQNKERKQRNGEEKRKLKEQKKSMK